MRINKDLLEFISSAIKTISQVSFFIGSILVILYLFSIHYAPFLTFSDTAWIIVLVFFIGLSIILFLGIVIVAPSFCIKAILSLDKGDPNNPNEKEANREQKDTKSLRYILFINKDIILYLIALPSFLSYLSFTLASYLSFILPAKHKNLPFFLAKHKNLLFFLIGGLSISISVILWHLYFRKDKDKNKDKDKEYWCLLWVGSFYFNFFNWVAISVYVGLMRLNYIELFLIWIFSFAIICVISLAKREHSFRFLLATLITFPFIILFICNKIGLFYKTPIKLLKLGQINMTFVLDQKYAALVQKQICNNINNLDHQKNKKSISSLSETCNLLKNSTLKACLLFRSPKGYLIKILHNDNEDCDKTNDKDNHLEQTIYIKDKYVKLLIFRNESRNESKNKSQNKSLPDKPSQKAADKVN